MKPGGPGRSRDRRGGAVAVMSQRSRVQLRSIPLRTSWHGTFRGARSRRNARPMVRLAPLDTPYALRDFDLDAALANELPPSFKQ